MLLPTKLAAPRATGTLVERRRLVERIEENLGRRATLISAPAGSGKSTLLGQWIRSTNARTAWLSLDGDDDDPRRFAAYVIAALGSIAPEIAGDAEALISSPGRIELRSVLTRSVVLPFAKAHERSALVLDDFHSVHQPEILDAVAWLIEQLPPHLHLVIASRSTPPFPLPRWRVRREVLELGAPELRFSQEEATAFYNDVMSLSLSEGDVGAIEARTEGWAAALQLSALSLKGGADARALARSLEGEHRLIAEYLAQEVLDRQPDRRRRFLLRTSILDRFTAELFEAVTGDSGAQDELRAIEAANLFLIPLDASGAWFRYHHLFGELLRKRLLSEPGEDPALLHRRAAEQLAANGGFEEAVRHAMASGPAPWSAAVVDAWGEALLMAGAIELLRAWTGSFPPELRARTPFIQVHAAWAAVLSGRPEEVEALAAEAEAAEATPEIADKVAQHVTGSRAFAAQHLGELERAVALSDAALAGPLLPEVRAALELNAGQSLRRLGRYQQAVEILDRAQRGGLETGHAYLAVGALYHRAASLRLLGQLQAALQCTEELEKLRGRARRGYMALSTGDVESAFCHWLRGDLEQALVHANGADAGLEVLTEPWDVAYGRCMLARILVSAGEWDEATAVVDEARLPPRPRERSMAEHAIETLRAELALERGDPESARELLQPRPDPDPETGFDRRWLEARIALAMHEPIDAEREFDSAKRDGRLMHATAWAALLARVRNDASSFETARRLAERTGITRYLSMLFGETDAPRRVRPAAVDPMVESLTQRELEVLGLIAEGLSNQQAAERLFVSVGTVKTHVHKILDKLAAGNRTEAVHRARAVGLIR